MLVRIDDKLLRAIEIEIVENPEPTEHVVVVKTTNDKYVGVFIGFGMDDIMSKLANQGYINLIKDYINKYSHYID